MLIAPSILTADFTQLGSVLDDALKAGMSWIHLDVMDGNWVVNKTITFGPAVIKSIRERIGPEVYLDCHLMITNAEETWMQYVEAGVDMVIFHIEAVDSPKTLIRAIRESGTAVGIVLNPDTSEEEVIPHLEDLDLVLVMSVVPGKGGQSFMPEVKDKVLRFKSAIDEQISKGGKSTRIMIDGGIKSHNIGLVSSWGVDISVVGSGLINSKGTISENYQKIIRELP
ncbi:MAG: ribulose-phosphate 3-epimerase [Euryarchaeota archaeon]|nr:ribulose-phosphate 3-epimerase [Euryarchaeota archaeon]|tara:strand:+ start:54147 stop:54824 length:678 start_codon:yes stop_codon:yes gene_type:complete